MSDVPTATKIAALEDHVLRLLSENVRLTNEAAEVRETLDSLRQSIYAACAGSGCLNAHELRVALDSSKAREEAYRADVVRLTAELQGERDDLADKCNAYGDALVEETKLTTRIAALEAEREEWRKINENQSILVMLTEAELDRERERCGVLEREVRAWRDACDTWQAQTQELLEVLSSAVLATDTSHALDAAKFVGGGALARNQPCGCVVCQCEDDNQCQGCGAKHCGTHPVGEIPNKKFVGGGCNG